MIKSEREEEKGKKIRVFAGDHSSRYPVPPTWHHPSGELLYRLPAKPRALGAPGWRISSRWSSAVLRRKREKTVATMPDAVESGCSRSWVHEPLFLHRLLSIWMYLGSVYRLSSHLRCPQNSSVNLEPIFLPRKSDRAQIRSRIVELLKFPIVIKKNVYAVFYEKFLRGYNLYIIYINYVYIKLYPHIYVIFINLYYIN